jgi:hypothetical protein
MTADLQWTALEWPGLEHVVASADADGFRADSQLIVGPPPGPARVSYQLSCDASWRFTALRITVTGAAGSRTLDLTASQDGRWMADGQPRRDLDGCTDIDISLTPLTNTLPIRRLSWSATRQHHLHVAYVSVPGLDVRKAEQRYTLLTPPALQGTGQRDQVAPAWADTVFCYQSGTYRADLPVDSDGLVIDYPGGWQRVACGSSIAA